MTLLIGDMLEALGLETQRNIVNLIDRHKKKAAYYLLITANTPIPGSNDIKTTLIMMSERPYKMLGTICLHVDNRAGKIDKLWTLPFDRPQVRYVDGTPQEQIFYDARRMPVIHG